MAGTGSLRRNNLLLGQNRKLWPPEHTIDQTECQQEVVSTWPVHPESAGCPSSAATLRDALCSSSRHFSPMLLSLRARERGFVGVLSTYWLGW